MKAVLFILTWWLVLAWANAATRASEAVVPAEGPFCGINSLYTALRAEGFRTDFSSLLQARYVSSADGSTVEELRRAACEQGAECRVLTNLSTSDLCHLDCPAVLHVKNEYDAPQYNHYVLCVPNVGGQLNLYDPPDPLVTSDGSELAAVWDGTAVLVSSKPISLWSIYGHGAVRVAWAAALILLLFGGVVVAKRRGLVPTRVSHGVLRQSLLVVLVGCLSGGVYHCLAPQGFAAQRSAIAAIADAFNAQPAQIVDLPQARSLLVGGARFIDARNASDFAEGHVNGAISIPPNATRLYRSRSLIGVAMDQPMVVYCQGPSCPYAKHLAGRLSRDGYQRISVFAGGWSQWAEAAKNPATDVPGREVVP